MIRARKQIWARACSYGGGEPPNSGILELGRGENFKRDKVVKWNVRNFKEKTEKCSFSSSSAQMGATSLALVLYSKVVERALTRLAQKTHSIPTLMNFPRCLLFGLK